MVDMPTEIIDNALFFFYWDLIKMLSEFISRVFLEKSSSFEEFRIIIDISLMMAIMMYLHGESIDMWLKRIEWVRERRKRVREHRKNKI